jgi:hypothetical protein
MFVKPYPISGQGVTQGPRLGSRPLRLTAEHHQPTMAGALKLAYQLFKLQHYIALPKVLHCAGSPLSKPRLNQL